ncbi:MAG: DEAD/DEAH box helicase [Verrucomicrobia bacterium]|nr:DEAD/DEAH box helicase [Verrucomicrobiota bacterium]
MDKYQIEGPKDLEAFLASLPPTVRQRGEEAFRQGHVVELRPKEVGREYAVDVSDGLWICEVELFHAEDEGWDGRCSCPAAFNCKHIYAAIKALLAEYTTARVRGLSATSRAPATKAQSRPEEPVDLAQTLSVALKRPLKKEENTFLRKLTQVYRRCCTARVITNWDLSELGLNLGAYSWDRLEVWPSFPKDEHEFWLYIANALLEQRKPIPEYMEPVTDLSVVRERLERWKRAREIERWRRVLEQATQSTAVIKRKALDFRLKLLKDHAALEWKREGADQFEPLKHTQCRQIEEDYDNAGLELSLEAELVWQGFRQRYYDSSGYHLRYDDDDDARNILSRLFRLPVLRDRIVNEQGLPFIRATDPLRWSVAPAQDEHGDYRLRLLCPDGTPLLKYLVALPGDPWLYVTPTTVFPGPAVADEVIDPRVENLIPAPAIESRAGVEFLTGLGIELPPRIKERVKRVPLRVKISCTIEETYPGSKTENCHVTVTAQSEDNAIEQVWTGFSWQDAPRTAKRANEGKRKDSVLIIYDRSTLNDVSRLMQPLDLKRDSYSGQMSLRVTKKFPEIFVPWLKSLPPEIELQLNGELATLAGDSISAHLRLDVEEVSVDWFDLKVVLNVSDTDLTADELKLLLDAKGRFVRLGKKGWRRLEFNLTEDEDERLARLGLNPHELTSEPQRLHALQLADQAAARFLPAQQVEQVQRRASEIKASVTPEIPPQVRAELRPYQREGFHFLAYLATNRFGGILADDMGLGKTLQTLTWLAWLRAQPGNAAKPVLAVCPKSVMDVWRSEAERFTPDLRVKVWRASDVEHLMTQLGEADLHVLNYSQLRLVGESLAPAQWLAVILDEGQYIKNPNSQTAQVARALRANFRLVLTGTPIENRLLDLWSLMAFTMPGVLGSRAQFARLFDQKGDPFARRRLAARVRPFLLRRTKTQVAKDLPDRIEEDLYCEIEGEQKALYRAELKRAQQLLLRVQTQEQLTRERFHFLTSLLRLRQICCHPALLNPESRLESAKVNALLEQLEPIIEEGHKVLVFSQFVSMLELLRTAVQEKAWPLCYLTGESENRGDLVQQFQAIEGAAVFLISLKAGGFGLNLTAASYVVLFDPWWNPAVENQAIDRTHRIGQTSKVMAYRLLIKDSIEEKIRALQKQKSALAEDVLGEEKFAQALTLEDLHYLFAD